MPGSNENSMAPMPSAASVVPTGAASTGGELGSAFSSALPSAGIGLAAAASDNLFGGLMNQAFAKRNAKLQYKYWKQMFDYQAAYNSPKAQLSRLYDAGINPLYNSQFSNGNNTFSGGISSLPSEIVSGNFGQNLERFLSLMYEGRQIDINQERAKAENAKDYASAGEAVANTKLTEINSQTAFRTAMANLRALDAQTHKTEEEVNFIKAQTSQCWSWIRDHREEVLQNWHKVAQGWKEQDTKYFTSQWQKNAALYANVTDRLQVEETGRHNKASERIEKQNADTSYNSYVLEQRKFQSAVKMQNWNEVKSIIEHCQSSVFGYKLEASQSDIDKMMGVFEVLSGLDPSVIDGMPLNVGKDALDFLGDVLSFGLPLGAAKAAPAVGKLGAKTVGKKLVGNSTWKRALERAVE